MITISEMTRTSRLAATGFKRDKKDPDLLLSCTHKTLLPW
jgi:hypothetical protein